MPTITMTSSDILNNIDMIKNLPNYEMKFRLYITDTNSKIEFLNKLKSNKGAWVEGCNIYLEYYKIKLFVYTQISKGCDMTALLPTLKTKINKLLQDFMEGREEQVNKDMIDEQNYLTSSNGVLQEHKSINCIFNAVEAKSKGIDVKYIVV
jgi:hypothetical protein